MFGFLHRGAAAAVSQALQLLPRIKGRSFLATKALKATSYMAAKAHLDRWFLPGAAQFSSYGRRRAGPSAAAHSGAFRLSERIFTPGCVGSAVELQ